MEREGGLRDIQRIGEVTHTLLALDQEGEEAQSRLIAERSKHPSDLPEVGLGDLHGRGLYQATLMIQGWVGPLTQVRPPGRGRGRSAPEASPGDECKTRGDAAHHVRSRFPIRLADVAYLVDTPRSWTASTLDLGRFRRGIVLARQRSSAVFRFEGGESQMPDPASTSTPASSNAQIPPSIEQIDAELHRSNSAVRGPSLAGPEDGGRDAGRVRQGQLGAVRLPRPLQALDVGLSDRHDCRAGQASTSITSVPPRAFRHAMRADRARVSPFSAADRDRFATEQDSTRLMLASLLSRVSVCGGDHYKFLDGERQADGGE